MITTPVIIKLHKNLPTFSTPFTVGPKSVADPKWANKNPFCENLELKQGKRCPLVYYMKEN